jgi:hypothetical protein
MNIGATTGALGSAAGAPLSQTAGSEAERTQKEASVQARLADAQTKSEKASGIGQMEQDQEASERDADGRRLWEDTAKKKEQEAAAEAADAQRQAKDPTGMSGNSLDLTG